MKVKEACDLQRAYYTETAEQYNLMHVSESKDGEHDLACSLLHGLSLHYHIESILDIGSGTGRVILNLRDKLPNVRMVGIEPVAALREIGYRNGISRNNLVEGDATQLKFANGSFDLVCECGTLHHIPNPQSAVAEMLRVAKKAIFISDSNRFGQGMYAGKLVKLFFYKMKLWPLIDYVKTKGKGYMTSEGDGISYSYSVFDDYNFIRKHCKTVMIFNLTGSGKCAVTGAGHIGLLGIK